MGLVKLKKRGLSLFLAEHDALRARPPATHHALSVRPEGRKLSTDLSTDLSTCYCQPLAQLAESYPQVIVSHGGSVREQIRHIHGSANVLPLGVEHLRSEAEKLSTGPITTVLNLLLAFVSCLALESL